MQVTDDEVQRYYEENQAEFFSPERVEARHILIKVAPDADAAAVAGLAVQLRFAERLAGKAAATVNALQLLAEAERILAEDDVEYRYRVSAIERVAPDAVEFVAQDGVPRLTLITCDDWNFEDQTYNSRLILIADPLTGN